jgi:pilus assembly protein CpaE
MQAVIVSDHEPTTVRARQVLLREGQDCPAANVVSLKLAADHLVQLRPDLLVFVLSPGLEQSLPVLKQLRMQSPARIVAVGPANNAQLILKALHAGASDYVDEGVLETGLKGALARVHSESATLAETGRLIALLAPSGGSGCSTLAANVATVLAREHKKVALFDLKLHAGDLAALLDLKPTHTLADLCQNAARMDRIMFERSLVQSISGVHLLAPPRTFADVVHVTPEGILQALTLARGLFPYVVVDLDHSFREEQVQVLRQADVVVVVLRLDFTSLRNTQRALDYLKDLGISKERVQLVVNRYGQPKEIPAAKAEEALEIKIAHFVPDDPKTVNRANNSGVPVVLESPSAKVSKSLVRLTASVNGQHAKH